MATVFFVFDPLLPSWSKMTAQLQSFLVGVILN